MSKELEEAIKRFEAYSLFSSDEFKKDFELIKSALERKEKLNNVWEIVKEKNRSVFYGKILC